MGKEHECDYTLPAFTVSFQFRVLEISGLSQYAANVWPSAGTGSSPYWLIYFCTADQLLSNPNISWNVTSLCMVKPGVAISVNGKGWWHIPVRPFYFLPTRIPYHFVVKMPDDRVHFRGYGE